MYQNKYHKYKKKYLDLKNSQIEQVDIIDQNSLTGGAFGRFATAASQQIPKVLTGIISSTTAGVIVNSTSANDKVNPNTNNPNTNNPNFVLQNPNNNYPQYKYPPVPNYSELQNIGKINFDINNIKYDLPDTNNNSTNNGKNNNNLINGEKGNEGNSKQGNGEVTINVRDYFGDKFKEISNKSKEKIEEITEKIGELTSPENLKKIGKFISNIYDKIIDTLNSSNFYFTPQTFEILQTIQNNQDILYNELINTKNLPLLIAQIKNNNLNLYYKFTDGEIFIEKVLKQCTLDIFMCILVEYGDRFDHKQLFDYKNNKGENIFHIAYNNPNIEMKKLLLLEYVDYNTKDKDLPPTKLTKILPKDYLAENIIYNLDLNLNSQKGNLPYYNSSFSKKKLVENYNKLKNKQYIYLLMGYESEVPTQISLENMIKYSLVPNFWIPNSFGEYIVNDINQTPLIRQVMHGNLRSVEYLINLSNKSDKWINIQDKIGKTAISYAIEKNDIDMIKILVAAGGLITEKDNEFFEIRKKEIEKSITKVSIYNGQIFTSKRIEDIKKILNKQ